MSENICIIQFDKPNCSEDRFFQVENMNEKPIFLHH